MSEEQASLGRCAQWILFEFSYTLYSPVPVGLFPVGAQHRCASYGAKCQLRTEEAMSEAYLPTQQPQARQEARFSPPHVDSRRPSHPQGTSAEGSSATVRVIWRVSHRKTFSELRRVRRVRIGSIAVSWVPTQAAEPPQVAYAIGRRVGPAVTRNRLRRRMRAILRESPVGLPPGAYLVTAGPEATYLSFNDLRSTLTQALDRLVTR